MKRYIPPGSSFVPSLENSIKEGVTAEVVIKALDYYLIPFALLLGASPPQIGALIAVPNLLGSFTLVISPLLIRLLKSRLKVISGCVGLQAFIVLPLGLVYIFEMPWAVTALIVAISFFRILGTIIGPAWGSLMSEYLSGIHRGSYFGGRSQIVGFAGVAATAFWALFLHFMSQVSEMTGYIVLFAMAGAFRFLSYRFVNRMQDLPISGARPYLKDMTFPRSLDWHQKNFIRFIVFVSVTTFATQLSRPYFSVWMLEGMELNYLWYSAIHLVSLISGLIAFPLWGKAADITGNAKILKRTSVLIAAIPLLWIFARDPLMLLLVEIFSGYIWSGFTLCSTNYVYDACSKEDRIKCLVYYNLMNGIAGFGGAFLGGVLAERLPPLLGHSLLSVFLLSGVLRLLGDLTVAGRFGEVRPQVRKTSSIEIFLSVIGIKPLAGRQDNMVSEQ